MATTTYTKTGTTAKTAAKLDKDIFGIDVTDFTLIQQAYEAYRANGRVATSVTLGRGEVRGGGRKPWKQKGTGRARHGSIRSPIWRGGGVTFGPSGNQNFSKKLSTKAKRTAIKQALSIANKTGVVKVIEAFDAKDGKVKPTIELMTKIGDNRAVLLVVEEKDKLVDRATRNVPYVKAVQAQYLNVYDILNAHSIIISNKSLDIISDWLNPKEGSKS